MARVNHNTGLHICLDNLSVARIVGLTPKGSSQEIFRQFREAAKSWLQSEKRMSVQWIPGHMGIDGNGIKTPPNIKTRRTQSLSSANAWQRR